MPATHTDIPRARFIRQARSERAALVATPATLDRAIAALKTAPWRETRPGLAVTLPASDPMQASARDAYEAFKFSGDAGAEGGAGEHSGVQAAFVGMAAHRFSIPSGALAGTPANATANVRLYADKFLGAGLRVAAWFSDDPEPPADWDTLRGDSGPAQRHEAVLPDPFAGTTKGTNKHTWLDLFPAPAPCARYLWVAVQLEDWPQIIDSYWIEGAGFLDAPSLSIAFDRDVAPDPGGGFSFPVDPADLRDQPRAYPVGALPDIFESTATWDIPAPPGTVRVAWGELGQMFLLRDGTVSVADDYVAAGQLAAEPETSAADISASMGGFAIVRRDGSVRVLSPSGFIPQPPPGLPPAVKVAIAQGFGLALLADGTLASWGTNASLAAKDLAGIRAVDIGAAMNNMFALTASGGIIGWGENAPAYGDAIAALSGVLRMRVARSHVLALAKDGAGTRVASFNVGSSGGGTVPDGMAGVTDIYAAYRLSVAAKSDGTHVAWGHDPATVAAAQAWLDAAAPGSVLAQSDGTISYLTRYRSSGAWRSSSAAATTLGRALAGASFSPPMRRDLLAKQIADESGIHATELSAAGGYASALAPGGAIAGRMSISAFPFRWRYRATSAAPNRLHFSVPAPALPGSYIRVILLKDNGPEPVNPVGTPGDWQTVWYGGVPATHTLLGSHAMVHDGAVNSVFIPVASPGASGTAWFVIIPIAPPPGDGAPAWDVREDGWDADRIFFWRE